MKKNIFNLIFFVIACVCVAQNGAVGNYETNILEDSIYEDVEVFPVFPTGDLGELRYWKGFSVPIPEKWGHLIFSAVIEKDGSVTNVKIQSSPCTVEQNEDFISYVQSMPKWKPAMRQGVPVRYRLTRTLRFIRPQ